MDHIQVFYLMLVVSGGLFGNCERLHERIYSQITGGVACFRRLNGTHQTGCSSSEKGTVGVVQMIKDVSDAQWMVFNTTGDLYMAVVSTSQFNNVIHLFLDHPEIVGGVLLYDNITDSASSFSHESRCPNEYSSASGSTCSSTSTATDVEDFVWNEMGTGLLRRDIPFPIFYLSESQTEEIAKIEQCYERFNLDKNSQERRPLCAIQLNSFMYAAVNTKVCLRRSTPGFLKVMKVCDPLGGRNVYYPLFPRVENEAKNKTITLVTARIDTTTLFDGLSPGAASSVVGMVTLVTAATTLTQMLPPEDAALYENNVMFTLFNGEAFDYMGSQRVAYDLSQGLWPYGATMTAANIGLHVELGQLGGALANKAQETGWPLFAYAPYNDTLPSQVADFLGIMTQNAALFNMTISTELTLNVPPSSLHSFRRILKDETESKELPEVLLVDHQKSFTNNFYHSVLDTYDKIKFVYRNISIDSNGTFISTSELLRNGTMNETDTQVKISQLATALARTLYQKVTGTNYMGNVTASAHLVDEMLYCFLSSQMCRLLTAADYGSADQGQTDLRPPQLYVSVARWPSNAPVLAGHLLALLTSRSLPFNRTACQSLSEPGLSQYWLKGWNHSGVCIQTAMNFSSAVSPAFFIPDYDMSSGMFSSWTESVWHAIEARLFVRASGGGAFAAALAAIASSALTAVATYWLRAHSTILFPPTAPLSTSGATGTVNC